MASRYIDGTEAARILDVPAEMLTTFVRRGNLRVTARGTFLRSNVEHFKHVREAQTVKHETWRQRLAPIIRQVLQDTQGQEEKAIRRSLTDAYPCAERRGFAYQCWLDEIQRQRGIKPPLGTHIQTEQERTALAAQPSLFD